MYLLGTPRALTWPMFTVGDAGGYGPLAFDGLEPELVGSLGAVRRGQDGNEKSERGHGEKGEKGPRAPSPDGYMS